MRFHLLGFLDGISALCDSRGQAAVLCWTGSASVIGLERVAPVQRTSVGSLLQKVCVDGTRILQDPKAIFTLNRRRSEGTQKVNEYRNNSMLFTLNGLITLENHLSLHSSSQVNDSRSQRAPRRKRS